MAGFSYQKVRKGRWNRLIERPVKLPSLIREGIKRWVPPRHAAIFLS